ncbi:unnamed protein product [Kluyveromyces dobzhanskii CBS 2104]|uniref:WGS project CCBQ000000000 data, contig 00104 n=1 Tax=Kluyveromyces dobzhanskii CBS 2104 TaxID=1427455 RepID=A0A0A8L3E2_9SACH|nr:unnamed protein product [Kluyveromyces dobzhanskii CBS 2104]
MYKLSVVSGGKVALPRVHNRSATRKSVSCLTKDGSAYIVPFNNQFKVYSIDTRQCIKALKFANNDVLSSIFDNDSVEVVHIELVNDDDMDKIRVYTNTGKVAVLKYKGKLATEIKNWTLDITGEVFAVLADGKKILTTQQTGNSYKYALYDLIEEEEGKFQVNHIETFENVLLSTWSNNNLHFAAVYMNQDSKKSVLVKSLVDNSVTQNFPVPSTTSSTTMNSHFVTALALDNNGEQLAIGFASGVINVINLPDLSHRLLKWHVDSVLSLGFTNDNAYLLSGGWEKVLSFWQLATNMQHFLPRLNGIVLECLPVSDKYYALVLQFAENNTSSDYQITLLNAMDLTSLLAINGPFPVFDTVTGDVEQPISTVTSKSSVSSSNMLQSKKKQKRELLKRKRHDFTAPMFVHPLSKHLYLPHVSSLQTYDLYKNEQVNYQYVTSSVNNAAGKVRLELTIQDPVVQDVKFTLDGLWMITYEVEYPPEGLLSSKELSHVLKFWQLDDNKEWQLRTKVLNPHGSNVPVTNIITAPNSINSSQGCLTADNNGGLKFWKFDSKQNNWCLNRLLLPNYNHFSNSVQLAWALDGSLIFHAFEDKLSIIEFHEFKLLEDENGSPVERTLDTPIQALTLVNDSTLIISTKTSLHSFNLLTQSTISSFDLYPYVNAVYKPGHFARLMAYDANTGRIAVAINQPGDAVNGSRTLQHKSHILIFNSDLTEKLGTFEHNKYISSLVWNYAADFIFMDIKSRLGIVSTTASSEMVDESNNDQAFESLHSDSFTEKLLELTKKKVMVNTEAEDVNDEDIGLEFINGNLAQNKTINMNSFTSLFENTDNVQMDTLFDRVMKIIT